MTTIIKTINNKYINNKYINNIVNNIVNNFFNQNKTVPIPLGRWQLKNNDKNINLVIDYSNEDHCGTCSYYINNKHKENKEHIEDINYYNEWEDSYLAEFELLNANNPNKYNKK